MWCFVRLSRKTWARNAARNVAISRRNFTKANFSDGKWLSAREISRSSTLNYFKLAISAGEGGRRGNPSYQSRTDKPGYLTYVYFRGGRSREARAGGPSRDYDTRVYVHAEIISVTVQQLRRSSFQLPDYRAALTSTSSQ